MEQDRNVSTSLTKALDVIGVLRACGGRSTLVELADLTQLPRTTVRRILNTLVVYGLLTRDGAGFALTPAFDAWSRPDPHVTLRRRYRPVLEVVAARVGELVLLGVPQGRAVVHIDYIEADHAVRVAPAPQTRHPLQQTAQGKIVLTRRPDWAAKFRSKKLLAELDEVRRTGIAWNREESEPGVVAAAVGGFTAAHTDPLVAVAWPVQRFDERQATRDMRTVQKLVRDAAAHRRDNNDR